MLSAKAQSLVTTATGLPEFLAPSQNTDYPEVSVVSNLSFRYI